VVGDVTTRRNADPSQPSLPRGRDGTTGTRRGIARPVATGATRALTCGFYLKESYARDDPATGQRKIGSRPVAMGRGAPGGSPDDDMTPSPREPVRALLAEAIVVHVATALGWPATARRAAYASGRLAAEVRAGIPADAVDPADGEWPADPDDPAAWSRAALGIGEEDDEDP